MNILEKAITFAVQAHEGMTRKSTTKPYIMHPIEATTIAASLTDDIEILAATVLHDVVEDTKYTLDDIKENFGERVAMLVSGDSENKREGQNPKDTWKIRKEETIQYTGRASRDEKIVIFSDKLANLRSICADYLQIKNKVWDRFNMKDPTQHIWYYKSFLETCKEFKGTEVYDEYMNKISFIERQINCKR